MCIRDRSRCIQLKLRPLKDYVVSGYLSEMMEVPESKADIYAAFARGNLGKAIHLASSEEFYLLYKEVLTLLKNIKEMDIPMLLDYIKKLQEDNLDLFECLDFMQLWYRDILMFKVTKDINTLVFKDEYGVVSGLCQKMCIRDSQYTYLSFGSADDDMASDEAGIRNL